MDLFVYLAHVYKLFYTEQEWTFVFLNGIGLDHCQCLLFGEEKVDLPHCLLVTFAAVQLVDRLVLHSKLGSQTGQWRTQMSAFTGITAETANVWFLSYVS